MKEEKKKNEVMDAGEKTERTGKKNWTDEGEEEDDDHNDGHDIDDADAGSRAENNGRILRIQSGECACLCGD